MDKVKSFEFKWLLINTITLKGMNMELWDSMKNKFHDNANVERDFVTNLFS